MCTPRPKLSNKDALLTKVCEPAANSENKITVVGCGSIGIACAMACIAQNVTTDVALIQSTDDQGVGEKTDLQQGAIPFDKANINTSTNLIDSAGSRICIITTGVAPIEGESRNDLISRNVAVFRKIIPKLVQYSPNAIFVVVANPVEILTYVTWRLSELPKSRVLGTGCMLDTTRFRYFISQHLGVSPSSVNGWIIGEHGNSCVPVWSSVNIAGVKFRDINPSIGDENVNENDDENDDEKGNQKDDDKWCDIHKNVIEAEKTVNELKGDTNWAISLCVSAICNAIIKNTGNIFSVTTCVNGEQDIDRDIFLALPCVVEGNGITHIIKQTLTDSERQKFLGSAELIGNIIDGICIDEIVREDRKSNFGRKSGDSRKSRKSGITRKSSV